MAILWRAAMQLARVLTIASLLHLPMEKSYFIPHPAPLVTPGGHSKAMLLSLETLEQFGV